MIRSMLAGAVAAVLVGLAGPPSNAASIESRRVQFAPGTSGTSIKAQIKGDQTIDYLLRAKAGQQLEVEMTTNNGANYFNILEPGSNDVAFHVGSTSGNRFAGRLPKDGDYRIRVYLMRSAARRGERANYTLTVAVTGHGQAAHGPPHDAKVPGTDFHATGSIACSMGGGQPTGSCPFGVKRRGAGSAIVTVTKPDGRTRAIVFQKGRATGADVSQADPGEFSATREGDLSIVRIGRERYEIWDSIVFGG